MIEYLSYFWVLLINSALFGLFTKLADLCDEHKWKPFKGAGILFGVFWGIFGAAVVIGSPLLGSFYLAILFHWILRGKIDYLNHRIATVIILISLIAIASQYAFDWYLFGIVFVSFTIFGFLRDYRIINKSWFIAYNVYAYVIIVVFALISSSYLIVLYSYLLNTIFYHIGKQLGHEK